MRRVVLSLLLAFAAAPLRAQIVVVTADAGPVKALSRSEAEQLYLGRRTTLDNGLSVSLVDLPSGAVRNQFYQLLTGKNPGQIRAYWSRQVFTGRALPPREAASIEEARELLIADPASIGYLPESELDKRLRVLFRLR
jgi:hypothetical protein